MSMSTHITAFRPADAAWERMRLVWEACKTANVDPPEEVGDFFGWEEPDSAGVEVDLTTTGAAKEYKTESSEGYEVDLRKIPPDIHIIRFSNNW